MKEDSEGGRAGEAADTELKTKTPHVNVGKVTAKLKLNGVKQVCQTCQADVNMQPEGQKC